MLVSLGRVQGGAVHLVVLFILGQLSLSPVNDASPEDSESAEVES